MKNLKDQKVDVIVTVKHNSSRTANKNTREFFSGKSLLDIKLEQLLKILNNEQIILLANHEDLIEYANKYSVRFVHNQSDEPGAALSDAILVHTSSDDIIRACVTTPFLDERVLLDMWVRYTKDKDRHDSCVSVEKIQSHLLSEHGKRLNYGLGFDYLMSQELEPMYSIKSGFFIFNRAIASRIHYFIGNHPLLYECGLLESLDINYPDEFLQAQYLLNIPEFRARVE